MEVGNRIREERDRANLSQEGLAEKIFVSRQTVSNWETGKTYPDVQSLLLMSNLFGVSIDSLVKGDIVAMNEELDRSASRMKTLAGSMTGLLVVSIAGAAYFLVADSVAAAVVWFVVFWAASMISAYAIERIKKAHNLQTYAQIKAFMDGEPVPDDAESSMPAWTSSALKALAGAAFGLVLAAICVAVWTFLAGGLS
ncbi:HTH-type transcriptional regulator immR [Slackia heliotrinireducens]|uniref:Predicted transcriptional regulator n=1 Tax=Slackia heliotrinireducens (strain ATCC 29202 / DSM 20476 / NCTC 11029 / RHS 1) TaxID=471855 RepID=C7N6T3_SLAHD|nr:helix-turn-helix transcriptional regulator [Slackia heliotrinireducens]ACV22618.1 predicted transcriptional regulator [Slackia heliotrinireducens DSM 20476]VEH01145.1 HTH-type transcriptional regulator immR [Slackia heliotrinireducens]